MIYSIMYEIGFTAKTSNIETLMDAMDEHFGLLDSKAIMDVDSRCLAFLFGVKVGELLLVSHGQAKQWEGSMMADIDKG